jgi:hypothetical protein
VWTLVLFTMVVGVGTGGGVHSTVTTLSFDTLPQYEAVERALAESGNLAGTPDHPAATYRIWGKCITPGK